MDMRDMKALLERKPATDTEAKESLQQVFSLLLEGEDAAQATAKGMLAYRELREVWQQTPAEAYKSIVLLTGAAIQSAVIEVAREQGWLEESGEKQ